MLNRDIITRAVSSIPEFRDPASQVLEGSGYDGITDILSNLREVNFPVIVIEDATMGELSIEPGAVNSFSQSLWVMTAMTAEDQECEVCREVHRLNSRIIANLLALRQRGEPLLLGWNHHRISYMKRHGGPAAIGFELVFTFIEDISLVNE